VNEADIEQLIGEVAQKHGLLLSRANQASRTAVAIAICAACVSGALAIAGPAFLETKPAFAGCQLSKP
jgi:hypothetical protein